MYKKIKNLVGSLCKRFYSHPDDTFSNENYINYFLYQKILRINSKVPWPVHFTSYVTGYKNIKLGNKCSPGSGPHQYIQAVNGIEFGDNILMGPGVTIISANHKLDDFNQHTYAEPIKIGCNVWLGANVIVLPGVKIGNNVVIGAGSVVTRDIPQNSIAVGVPCKVTKTRE